MPSWYVSRSRCVAGVLPALSGWVPVSSGRGCRSRAMPRWIHGPRGLRGVHALSGWFAVHEPSGLCDRMPAGTVLHW